jgi:ankyrin repeat protein
MIEVLLRAGAKINGEDSSGSTPIHRAALYLYREDAPGDIEVLIHAGADVNHKNREGESPLHEAGSLKVVQALLRAGADVHSRDQCSWTPLHRTSSAKVAEALLRAGADVNSRDWRNLTPLHFVWQNRGEGSGIELAKVLVDAGADLNACADVGPSLIVRANDKAWTPLAWIQADRPRILCTYPFGPSRKRAADLARRKAKHSEIVTFLQGL